MQWNISGTAQTTGKKSRRTDCGKIEESEDKFNTVENLIWIVDTAIF
jgi:hypothetical protein